MRQAGYAPNLRGPLTHPPMLRLLCVALLLVAPASLAAQPSLVILVRHAERDTAPPRDPVLTAAGQARAAVLREVLAGTGIGSIIVTQFRRTELTARPLADSLHLTPIVVAAASPVPAHAAEVAAAVRARPSGEAVLVVGHSNTIPAIIAALGGPKLPDLCDSQYSSLFVLALRPDAPPRLVQASYGAPDRPDPACARTMSR